MERPLIGIIGGMGPHAGVYLAERITSATLADGDAEHVSLALLSCPGDIPDRTGFLLGDSPASPAPAIARVAGTLAGMGASVLGMPCNTAHSAPILDPVLATLKAEHPAVRFIHLIEETVRFGREMVPDATRFGILATTGTYSQRLYWDAFRRAGLEAIRPEESIRTSLVQRALYDPHFGIKTVSSPVSEEAIELLALAAEHLAESGAEALVLGCTELPLAIPGNEFVGLPVVDSTTALARALIRAVDPIRLAPLEHGPPQIAG